MPDDLLNAVGEIASAKVTSDTMSGGGVGAAILMVMMLVALPFFLLDQCKNDKEKAARVERQRIATKEEIKKSERPIREALKHKAKDKLVDIILK